MVGITVNSRGRYKCDFCNHTTYKTWGGAHNHVTDRHPNELALAEKDAEIERLKNRPPKVVEKVVYKDRPAEKEKKYWYIKNGGGIYCETCKVVEMRVGIPEGQTIENTPHTCGNRTLKLVLECR